MGQSRRWKGPAGDSEVPTGGVFNQEIFPKPGLNPVGLNPGVSGLSQSHTHPLATSICSTQWNFLPSSGLSAFKPHCAVC